MVLPEQKAARNDTLQTKREAKAPSFGEGLGKAKRINKNK